MKPTVGKYLPSGNLDLPPSWLHQSPLVHAVTHLIVLLATSLLESHPQNLTTRYTLLIPLLAMDVVCQGPISSDQSKRPRFPICCQFRWSTSYNSVPDRNLLRRPDAFPDLPSSLLEDHPHRPRRSDGRSTRHHHLEESDYAMPKGVPPVSSRGSRIDWRVACMGRSSPRRAAQPRPRTVAYPLI